MKIPVSNDGSTELWVMLEPEGHTFGLQPAETLTIVVVGTMSEIEIEVDLDNHRISIGAMRDKEVWQDGKQLR